MPTKGISKRIYLMGPKEPANLERIGNGFLPEGTEYFFHDYNKTEQSMQRISQKLESIGILHVYESWKLMRPLASRKDLWAPAILWENGGIMIDGKFNFEAPSTEWIDWENDEMIQIADTFPSLTYTGIEAYTQYHPLLVE